MQDAGEFLLTRLMVLGLVEHHRQPFAQRAVSGQACQRFIAALASDLQCIGICQRERTHDHCGRQIELQSRAMDGVEVDVRGCQLAVATSGIRQRFGQMQVVARNRFRQQKSEFRMNCGRDRLKVKPQGQRLQIQRRFDRDLHPNGSPFVAQAEDWCDQPPVASRHAQRLVESRRCHQRIAEQFVIAGFDHASDFEAEVLIAGRGDRRFDEGVDLIEPEHAIWEMQAGRIDPAARLGIGGRNASHAHRFEQQAVVSSWQQACGHAQGFGHLYRVAENDSTVAEKDSLYAFQ